MTASYKFNKQEDQYLEAILNLEAKVKKNGDMVVIMSNYVQAMFMLGPKPMSFYDSQLKHGLGYKNLFTLKQAIYSKLYDASYLHSSNVRANVYDTEEIIEDATKSQLKMKEKLKDLIAIEKEASTSTVTPTKCNYSKEFPEDVQVMMNVFELMESDLNERLKQNEILEDRLLEVTPNYDVERYVLMCSDSKNDNLNDEIEKVKRESIDIQENLLK
ncbi:hypothetical protein Tco_1274612 [Tanacetum coccineum]